MTEQELKTALKSPKGGFLFFGEEEYLVSHYAAALRKAVCPDTDFAAAFNCMILDGEDAASAMGRLLDAVMAPPMMAEKKFVELRDPDLTAIAAKEESAEALYEVLRRLPAYDHTVLLIRVAPEHFDAGYLPKRPSAMYRTLSGLLQTVEFSYPAPAKLRMWIQKHFAGDGVEVSPELCSELVARCGRSMRTLSFEIEKLTAYVLAHGESVLTREIVANVTCASMGEDAFELANAILDGSRERAFASLLRRKLAREEPVAVLAGIARVWCDLLAIKAASERGFSEREIAARLKQNEYRVKLYCRAASKLSRTKLERAVQMCAETDYKLKSSPLGYIAIERLLCACL